MLSVVGGTVYIVGTISGNAGVYAGQTPSAQVDCVNWNTYTNPGPPADARRKCSASYVYTDIMYPLSRRGLTVNNS